MINKVIPADEKSAENWGKLKKEYNLTEGSVPDSINKQANVSNYSGKRTEMAYCRFAGKYDTLKVYVTEDMDLEFYQENTHALKGHGKANANSIEEFIGEEACKMVKVLPDYHTNCSRWE